MPTPHARQFGRASTRYSAARTEEAALFHVKRAGADGGIWCRCFAGSRISGTRRCRLEVTGLSGRAGPAAVDGTIAVRRVTESAIRPRARPAISANRGTGRLRRVAELQLSAELHPVIALTPAPNRASERTGRHARSSPAPTDEAALFHVKRGRGATEAFGAALPAGSRISGTRRCRLEVTGLSGRVGPASGRHDRSTSRHRVRIRPHFGVSVGRHSAHRTVPVLYFRV